MAVRYYKAEAGSLLAGVRQSGRPMAMALVAEEISAGEYACRVAEGVCP